MCFNLHYLCVFQYVFCRECLEGLNFTHHSQYACLCVFQYVFCRECLEGYHVGECNAGGGPGCPTAG